MEYPCFESEFTIPHPKYYHQIYVCSDHLIKHFENCFDINLGVQHIYKELDPSTESEIIDLLKDKKSDICMKLNCRSEKRCKLPSKKLLKK